MKYKMKKQFFIAFAFCLLTSALFSQGTWTQKADLAGTARVGAIGFSIGTKGYIGIGEDVASATTQTFWEWNQASNVWTQKADFAGNPRQWAAGFSIGSKGYVGTGFNTGYIYKDFWEWDQ